MRNGWRAWAALAVAAAMTACGGDRIDEEARAECERTAGVGMCVERGGRWLPIGARDDDEASEATTVAEPSMSTTTTTATPTVPPEPPPPPTTEPPPPPTTETEPTGFTFDVPAELEGRREAFVASARSLSPEGADVSRISCDGVTLNAVGTPTWRCAFAYVDAYTVFTDVSFNGYEALLTTNTSVTRGGA